MASVSLARSLSRRGRVLLAALSAVLALALGPAPCTATPQAPSAQASPESPPASPPAAPRPTPAPPQPLSRFEHYVRSETPPGMAADLFQFGYEMFAQAPSTFAPVDTAPVGPDYVLGPGDSLRIAVWGKVNEEHRPTLDRDGRISLPVIGPLHLAGLTFAQAQALIKDEFSRYYRDISLDVSMGPLRTMQVYVVGRAAQPGCYTISSLSTMVNALFAAGGPSKVGTMRDIQLKRAGRTVARLDLYDLLIRGDKTGDARLLPEDVIFIPPAGPLVAIAGNVRLPAVYELKAETRATELIALAGGINEVGFRNRLQLLRVEEGKEQRLIELDLEQVMAGADLELQGGDVLKVYAVAAIVERTVHVTGPVKNPGLYGLKPGMRVSDLLRCTGGLLRYASREAELSRIRVTQQGPQTERFAVDLAAAAAGDPAHDLQLEGDDYLFVRSVPEWETQQVVNLSGQVRYPGAYAIARGERLSHLLERAGGFTGLAYLKGAVFTRLSAKKLQQQRLQESIDRLEEELLRKSAGTVQAALSTEEATQAESAAARRQGLIARLRTVEAQGRVTIRLQEPARLRGTPSDLTLEAGDTLSVPQRPEFVQVMGSVYNPAAFIYDPGATVGSYLKKAGDPTAEADEDSIYVLKADGTVVSKRQGGWFGAHWDGGWMGGFYSVRIDPGDTVVVPVELDRINWLREVKDLTQVLYQIAITAGIMFIAF